MSAPDFEKMARELHTALGLGGFESDMPKIAAALRSAYEAGARDEREAIMPIVHEWSPDEIEVLKRIRARGEVSK